MGNGKDQDDQTKTSRGKGRRGPRRRSRRATSPPEPATAAELAPRYPDESTLCEPASRGAAEAPASGPGARGFEPLGLSAVALAALGQAGYFEPTPVQAALIPRVLAGEDVMAQAQTGTGKTAAFAVPLLERLAGVARPGAPQALVLTPTRELAVQVRDECRKLAAGRPVNIAAVYGGKPIRQHMEQLRRGVNMLVGTPGRLLDLMRRGALALDRVRFVVLDEADRMLDIGFRPDIEKILRRCPAERQTLLLSATIPPPVRRLAERYMRRPSAVDCSQQAVAVETIEQFYFSVDAERKFELLLRLLQRDRPQQAIIFCRTKRGADRLFQRLARKLDSVDVIHGDLAQPARDRAMARFREGATRLLVATDVMGRGIDVTSISHIINYDIPEFCDDYVHRVGRTGRMGRQGVAYTFVTPEEGKELTRIEMRINRLLKRDEIPGFEAFSPPQSEQAAEPVAAASAKKAAAAKKTVFGRRTRRHRRAL